jgi:hypothetical protein
VLRAMIAARKRRADPATGSGARHGAAIKAARRARRALPRVSAV